MQQFKVGDISLAAYGAENHMGLSEFLVNLQAIKNSNKPDLELHATHSGLTLVWNRQSGLSGQVESLRYFIDVAKFVLQQRSYPAPKQGAFNQALGKKTRRVVDATAGWGGDALLMVTQAYNVTLIERQPIMALLLRDAMTRLSMTQWALNNPFIVPTVICDDSTNVLKLIAADADCVYLDPMFPPKKKKSAAVNKNMQLLQWLVGADYDSDQLIEAAMAGGAARIAVKRPDHAAPLLPNPSVQFSSKLVHYDVYLRNGI